MKRFLLFAGDQYYPRGGWDDFIKDFDSLESAIEHVARRNVLRGWIHIVDTESKSIVWFNA